MYIYKIVSKADFLKAFETHHNGQYKSQFTNEALSAIYDTLVESACDIPVELDVIAICCTYSQTSDQNEITRIKDAGAWYQELSDGSVVYVNY